MKWSSSLLGPLSPRGSLFTNLTGRVVLPVSGRADPAAAPFAADSDPRTGCACRQNQSYPDICNGRQIHRPAQHRRHYQGTGKTGTGDLGKTGTGDSRVIDIAINHEVGGNYMADECNPAFSFLVSSPSSGRIHGEFLHFSPPLFHRAGFFCHPPQLFQSSLLIVGGFHSEVALQKREAQGTPLSSEICEDLDIIMI